MKAGGKPDANQAGIVQALRSEGYSVAITSKVGGGFPDLVVGHRGRNLLLEVKDGAKPPSKRRLTEKEAAFVRGWSGQVAVVESEEDALTLCAEYLAHR